MSAIDDYKADGSPENFVLLFLWMMNEGVSITEMSRRLGISERAMSSRVHFYREKGVKLPFLKSGRKKIDKDSLNALIEKEGK